VGDLLNRPNIQAKFPAIDSISTAELTPALLKISSWFDPVPAVFTWPVYLDDDHLFNLVIHASADYLVTWETRLLEFSGSGDAASIRFNHLALGQGRNRRGVLSPQHRRGVTVCRY
jgi:predicted nucleic acid-binding protein